MSSRSRWLRWVSGLPAGRQETFGLRLRYLQAESDARRARSVVVETWDSPSRARYMASADSALSDVVNSAWSRAPEGWRRIYDERQRELKS